MQSSVFAMPSALAATVLVHAVSGSATPSNVAPTVLVELPTLEETKAAFGEISSAFQDMSAKYGQIQGNLQTLVNTVDALCQAKQQEQEAFAQVQ